MNLLLLTGALVLAASPAQALWDFSYAYDDVFATNANDYTVSEVDALKVNEGGGPATTYYQPAAGSLNEGVITMHWSFASVIDEVFLTAYISTFHWSYGQGWGWLHASKDGSVWTELTYVGPPAYGGANWGGYVNYLPGSLTGGTDIWIRATIDNTSTNPGSAPFRNTAQFSRSFAGDAVDAFRLDVNFVPEPAATLLLLAGLLGLALQGRKAAS